MAFLSTCADSQFEITDKIKANDPNEAYFRLALSIQ